MKHPLAIDLLNLVDGQRPEFRMMLAHIAACEPCRIAVVNIIQSSPDYPDLFADPEITRYWTKEPL